MGLQQVDERDYRNKAGWYLSSVEFKQNSLLKLLADQQGSAISVLK